LFVASQLRHQNELSKTVLDFLGGAAEKLRKIKNEKK